MNTAIVEKKMRAVWEETTVTSPHISKPVRTIAAKNIPYVEDSNRLQNLHVYLPATAQHERLVGTKSQPEHLTEASKSRWLVYIHGGAWRDPLVLADTVEPTVAHAFEPAQNAITAVASINYSLSPHPSHPTDPYDPAKGDQNDNAREFQHPRHILDVVAALDFLRNVFGLGDEQYVLTGHSCGATLALQATLAESDRWSDREKFPQPPRPAAALGLNGLYNLPMLVHEPDTHTDLADIYASFLRLAFGNNEDEWKNSSPACFDSEVIARRAKKNATPKLVVLDQSTDDQLVPMNQTVAMQSLLETVPGIRILRSETLKGSHNEPWESGLMLWHSVQEILDILQSL